MLSCVRYIFFLCFAIVSSFLTSFYFHEFKGKETESRRDISYIAEGSLTPLGDNRTLILSPYYDSRGTKVIRVLAIIHHEVGELYCRFHCEHKEHVPVRAAIELHSDRFGFPYGTADLLCTEPADCDYNYVSVHWSSSGDVEQSPVFEIRNRAPESFSANFTVCISTLYGNYKNVLQLIQSIEMYKLLGAHRVTIYRNSCHETVDKVLQYYVKEGFMEVISWPIDRYLRTSDKWHYSLDPNSEIGYYAQTATLNDCIYRNMYRSKFVLLNDIDEIILPVKHRDWKSLMNSLQEQYPQTSIFLVENHVFPTSIKGSELNMWSNISGVNILHNTYREPNDPNAFNNRKMIVDPRKVFQSSVHSALKADGQSTNLPPDAAILFHCKKATRPELTQEALIEDQTILRYNVSLARSVDHVARNICPDPASLCRDQFRLLLG
ncbi:uncharacterized protein LOC142467914 [Ascaphus truei]|uniref:uncharacterized protein LOC142467914 n=1 Tax=Ascaphus truei TaxID=8439 RepID=UPI003F59027E